MMKHVEIIALVDHPGGGLLHRGLYLSPAGRLWLQHHRMVFAGLSGLAQDHRVHSKILQISGTARQTVPL